MFPADLVTFTEEILNGKFHFLCTHMFTNKNTRFKSLFRALKKNMRCSLLQNSSIVDVWQGTKYTSEICILNMFEVSNKDNRVTSIDAVQLIFIQTLKIAIILI